MSGMAAASPPGNRSHVIAELRELLEQAPGFICMLRGPEHVFDYVNAAHRRIFASDDWVGRPVRDAIPELDGQGFFDALDSVYATGRQYVARSAPARIRRETGDEEEQLYLDFVYAPMRDSEGRVQGVFCEGFDVTERVRAERLAHLQAEMLELAAGELPLGDALAALILAVERYADHGLIGSVLLLAADGTHLSLGAAPSLPDAYNRGVDGIAIGPSAGSCGTAAHRGERVCVADIATDPLWTDFRELALEHGLRACWSVPIRSSGGDLLGTFAFYYRAVRAPSAADLDLAGLAARSAALLIERRRAAEDLARRSAQLQGLAEAALAIAGAPGLNQTLEEITQAARAVVGAHQCVVSLTRDADWAQAINAVALSDKYAQWRDYAAAPDGSGIYAWVCERNEPVRMTQAELEAHPRWRAFGDQAGEHPPMRGWLAAPLIARDGRNLGLIQLSDKDDGGEFDETDEAVLVQFARLAAAAVEQTLTLEQLAVSERRLEAMVNSIDQMIWSTRSDGYHDFYNERWYEYTGVPSGSTDGEAWNGMFHPEDQERAWTVWRRSLETGEPYHIEYRLRHHSGQYRWVIGRAQPVRDEQGEIVRWYGTCTDIHDLKTAEEQRELIARELSHRIKNIFAVVLSIVGLSARGSPEARGFAESLSERIGALALAHEFIRPHSPQSNSPSEGSTVHGLLRTLLAPYDSLEGSRLVIAGCDAALGPGAATGLALVIHELATNASKYGALSRPGGRVEISCDSADGAFSLRWREIGGPPIAGAPDHAGFGSTLSRRVAAGQLGAEIRQEWHRDGLIVSLSADLGRLRK
jgi:PAS domain S-box-containing protein